MTAGEGHPSQDSSSVVGARRERDENFATIKTICKVLCDLDCENGCDEGLEYEGDEWCPCPCIYRHRLRVAELTEALKFYANPNRWDGAAEVIWQDSGTRARSALERGVS